MQATQLSNNEEQERTPGPHGDKEVLPFLQQTPSSPRNEIIKGFMQLYSKDVN